MYNAEITLHQGSEREYTLEERFFTLEEAVTRIETWSHGQPMCRAWINDKEVRVKACRVLGGDGSLFCTNEAWHHVFAPESYPQILPNTNYGRKYAQTNPATLEQMGKL